MGPAFAVPVAPKAMIDKAIIEATAVIEIIFTSISPLTGMSTLNMEIGGREIDYRKIHFGHPIATNRGVPAHWHPSL
jgi:hypothetical protein